MNSIKSAGLFFGVFAGLLLLFFAGPALALSRPIGRDMEFPKGYDPAKAKAILAVVQDKRFEFTGGIVSYWPPDWSTRLSFTGDTDSLNEFLGALRRIDGIGLRMILYHGRNDELRRDSPWQIDFSHARPDQLTVYLNVDARSLDLGKMNMPEWPPATCTEKARK